VAIIGKARPRAKRSIVISWSRPGPLAAKNVQLKTTGENGDDEAHMFKHAENTMAVNPKTLDF